MKTKTKKMAVPAIVAALMASLAPVPAKSTIVPETTVELQNHSGFVSTLTFNLVGEQVFLPLSEATAYLTSLNDHKRDMLAKAIEERVIKGKGPLFESTAKIVKLAKQNIVECQRIKEAIRLVLSHENLSLSIQDKTEREEFKASLIKFGRAVATSEYLAENILSAVEQSLPPKKSSSTTVTATSEEVKNMIRAEHRNLGLGVPVFDQAS
ncbi:iron-sulfur cluster assembly scaffold protein SufA [Serratia fonticola]|uniref:iron-sulfur cluster assembly scaffold protein SufA n=1 Tax=Serratia fonticola TaxID=47917 RepID=UPI000E2C7460|nr:iron-sulfur cluster assembly scaffold protein SufA [Serratia fonticola]RDL25958.1 hypothetical protein DFO62_10545 [Serratia fonticola]